MFQIKAFVLFDREKGNNDHVKKKVKDKKAMMILDWCAGPADSYQPDNCSKACGCTQH